MSGNISKICADTLRTFVKEKYNTKLKAAHAHELVAAYFGYSSRNAMLADEKYPASNLVNSEIIVMKSDDFIDKRRNELNELPAELPDSYSLGEAVYISLFNDDWWGSEYPPFRSFEKLAKVLVENNEAYKSVFSLRRNTPAHHAVIVKDEEDSVTLVVYHADKTSKGEMLVFGETTIILKRISGRIGFSKPRMRVGQWTGDARRTLKSLGIEL